jgi:hypothetical protein
LVNSARPLSTEATFGIFACIFAGALLALVPLIARFERQKNEALDERQRELEALARTVSASAEQISIAAKGLHEIADITHKNLRHAEQLPQKLQEKIAEFQVQVANVSDAEKDELEKEVETLRASESEKLETIANKIAKSVADWTKLEASTAQHLAAATEAIAKLSFGTASAIGKAQVAAEQALSQARIEAARTFGEASGNAAKSIEAAKAAALAEIEAKTRGNAAPAAPLASDVPATTPPAPQNSAPAEAAPKSDNNSASTGSPVASGQPARSRKTTRTPDASTGPDLVSAVSAVAIVDDRATAIVAPEPEPILAARIAEIAPVAPHTPEPFEKSAGSKISNGIEVAAPAAHANGESTPTIVAKPPRKRTPKKAPAEALGLGIDEPSADADTTEAMRSGLTERVITSDGATRLMVTAYIGIGNRLFIRGEGPGLSWDKGVPLQFVSIGKWRWETNDASSPVKFKLFKNDDLECSALGAQSLEPGHQQELTAAF